MRIGQESEFARRGRRRERVLKTVGVLPSLATLGNLTCGLGAIYLCLLHAQSIDGDEAARNVTRFGSQFSTFLAAAAYVLVAGMVLDGIDGRLARLARKTSEFGAQLDSLADIVTFGVAPAFLVLSIAQPATFSEISSLSFGERAYWRAEWVMAAVYVACAALRLARFNVENEEDESAHMGFRGLPSPGAAGAIIGLVIFHQGPLLELAPGMAARVLAALMPPFALTLGLLMVSRFHYPHMVNTILRGRRPFWQVVSMAIVLMIGLLVQFELTLAIATAAYALSGPIAAGVYKILGRSPADEREPLVEELGDENETFDEEGPDGLDDDGPAGTPRRIG